MKNKEIIKNVLEDIAVELGSMFDNNFSKGGYFGKSWQTKRSGESSFLQCSGVLRKSLNNQIKGSSVIFTSHKAYADIHNNGGEIAVTQKMRGFFWRKYYDNKKEGKLAQSYKYMALKPVCSKIKIPQRQFIGDSSQVRKALESVLSNNFKEYTEKLKDNFQQQIKK